MKRGKSSKKPKPSSVRYDWDALKAEWIQRRAKGESISLNAFRLEKQISSTSFYPKVDEGMWEETLLRITEKALQKAETKTVEEVADRFRLEGQVFDTGVKQAAYILQQNVDPTTGKLKNPMDAAQLATVMLAAYRAFVSKRLLEGKATAIVDDRRITINALIQLENEIKKSNPSIMNSTHTIPNIEETVDEEMGKT